ncbi:CTNA1 protein, partial [Zosterops hypoxanthus]|nr:CTNA1 protein [Zosterops hypoxanthus]
QVANLACSISNNEEGVKLVRMSASQLEALCPQVRKGITTGDKPQPAGQLVLLRMCSVLIEQSSPSLQLNFKMLKLSFLMEMENYCCEMLGIAACACLCLAEHGGKVFFAFSLNTELANGELGKDFVYLDSETWILTPSSGVCALFLRRTCFGSLQRLFCNSILHLRCLGRELKPSEYPFQARPFCGSELLSRSAGSVGCSSTATRQINISAEIPAVTPCITRRKGKCSKCLLYMGTQYWKSKETFPSSFGSSASVYCWSLPLELLRMQNNLLCVLLPGISARQSLQSAFCCTRVHGRLAHMDCCNPSKVSLQRALESPALQRGKGHNHTLTSLVSTGNIKTWEKQQLLPMEGMRRGLKVQIEASIPIFGMLSFPRCCQALAAAMGSCEVQGRGSKELAGSAIWGVELGVLQVINAALALAAKPQSKLAQENMDLFKEQWERQVRVLTDAVDDITSIDDFLAVSENHILEDVNKCVIALQEKDVDGLDRTAGAIRGRAARVIHVVTSEMDNYEPGVYTEKVLEATKLLSNTVMPRFTEQVEAAVEALSSDPAQPMDENEFIDASRLVYDGIRDIRKAVLMIRTPEELDDSDFETEDFDVRSRTSIQTEDDQLIAGQSARAIMAQLPQEQKAKIAEQVASFQEEKSKLDAEVSKWDDSGNDIIVLAKQMCMIMMEMTDFTRGKGPLKNTSDVISAAKKIAEAGSRMDKLGRTIADHCPDSACKQDLLAYLQRIALYCHQLNICSKVKAEVQNLGGELVVSGVDSAMSLIQAAKNLMNAVVQTVKASYVASTKYQKSQGMASLNLPAVSWKMKAPEKKPLVKREKQDETQTKIKRASQKKHVNPVQALSEFKAMESI